MFNHSGELSAGGGDFLEILTIDLASLTGIGNHYGGSCQVGFSVDGGEIFRVATSFEGNCPHRHATDSQDFNFTVPADIPTGNVVFAW